MICQAFNRIEQVRAETSLSYFEFGTLAALAIFADAELDVQLLEVGMGGRLDAVNMIEPDATIITTIAIDHVDWLGNTLESIGREKAGIFRAGVPAIVGDENPPLSVLSSAKEKNAQLFQFGQHFNYQKQGELWTWFSDELSLQNLPLPIFKGEHQYRNASAIIMTVMQLQSVISVTDQAIRSGLQQAELKGRFQFISGDKPVLLDVGHNPQAVQTLVDYLRLSFPLIKIHAVFAMMKDKDIVSVISLMRDYVHEWYLAPLKNPRAASEEVLLNYFLQQQINAVHSGFTDFSSTFTAAQNNAAEGELILVFGSFFLVSEYLSKFA
jgi:dihydrofolate synthase/folylpolyglutamate synthase